MGPLPHVVVCLLAVAGMLGLGPSPVYAQTKITGDPQGIALARAIDAAYVGVPGFEWEGTVRRPGMLGGFRTQAILTIRRGCLRFDLRGLPGR